MGGTPKLKLGSVTLRSLSAVRSFASFNKPFLALFVPPHKQTIPTPRFETRQTNPIPWKPIAILPVRWFPSVLSPPAPKETEKSAKKGCEDVLVYPHPIYPFPFPPNHPRLGSTHPNEKFVVPRSTKPAHGRNMSLSLALFLSNPLASKQNLYFLFVLCEPILFILPLPDMVFLLQETKKTFAISVFAASAAPRLYSHYYTRRRREAKRPETPGALCTL